MKDGGRHHYHPNVERRITSVHDPHTPRRPLEASVSGDCFFVSEWASTFPLLVSCPFLVLTSLFFFMFRSEPFGICRGENISEL